MLLLLLLPNCGTVLSEYSLVLCKVTFSVIFTFVSVFKSFVVCGSVAPYGCSCFSLFHHKTLSVSSAS